MTTAIERLQTALDTLRLKAVEARLESLLEQASKKEAPLRPRPRKRLSEVQGWGIFDRNYGEFSTGIDTKGASSLRVPSPGCWGACPVPRKTKRRRSRSCRLLVVSLAWDASRSVGGGPEQFVLAYRVQPGAAGKVAAAWKQRSRYNDACQCADLTN